MGKSKNPFIRYKILDKCFSDYTRRYYWQDLLESVNTKLEELGHELISERTVKGDISDMESEEGFSAPIKHNKDGRRTYYRYDDPTFSILNSPVTAKELEMLRNAFNVLDRFEGEQGFEWIPETKGILSENLIKKNNRKIIEFETNHDYSGAQYIMPLYNATLNQNVLIIQYRSFSNDEFIFNFHPAYLKQFNRRWFVFGINDSNPKEIPWVIPLDRITQISNSARKYKTLEISWVDFFEDIVGVTNKPDAPVDIVLRFSENQGKYVITKPLHSTQTNRILESGELEVSINVKLNYELESLILGFGNHVEVLKPRELREKISARLQDATNKYC